MISGIERALPLFRPAEDVVTYSYGAGRNRVWRTALLRDGRSCRSSLRMRQCTAISEDPAADFDRAWLDREKCPAYRQASRESVRVVDLFCGLGGMSLGVAEAARAVGRAFEVEMAADIDPAARRAYQANFAPRRFITDRIEEHLDGALGSPTPTSREARFLKGLGPIDVLLAGPPCQGHSDLNNHTRREDPKNWLFTRVARFAELVEPTHIIIENVRGVLFDKERVLQRSIRLLEQRDYQVDCAVLRGERVGIPQTRHRVFVVASRRVTPTISLWEAEHRVEERSFTWACGGLPQRNGSALDRPTTLKAETQRRIDWLHDNDRFDLPDERRPPCHRDNEHSYRSVYGRILPDRPTATITTGFTVMGQGRYVHPSERRTLTPREGARLQFLPAWFSLGDLRMSTRRDIVTLIGNAVPPKMTFVLGVGLLR